jgi:hypothetical protein
VLSHVALVENQSKGGRMKWKKPASALGAGTGLRRMLFVALLVAGPLLFLCVSAGLETNDPVPTAGGKPKDGYIGSQAC